MNTTHDAERMSSTDRAWLEMDEPHNPMVASAIFELDRKVGGGDIGHELAALLIRHRRFRQFPDSQHRPPLWVDDDELDLGYHVHVVHLDGARQAAQMHALINQELARELDRFRPLWRLMIFERRNGPTTVLFRAHHAIADGIALMQLLLACTDEAPATRIRAKSRVVRRSYSGPLGNLIRRLDSANHTLEGLRNFALVELRHPSDIPRHLADGRQIVGAARRLLSLPDNNPPDFRRPLNGQRAVAWVDDLPLSRLLALARVSHVTLNDLFLGWVAGAFNRYLCTLGKVPAENQNLRISVPVNLRTDDGASSGNCFGLVMVDLPIGMRDSQARMQLVKQRMDALKSSGEAKATLLSLAAVGYLPVPLQKALVTRVAAKAAAVVSNLRGPDGPRHLCGRRLRNLVFWPPQSGGIGIGLSLFSHDGKVTIGVCVDRALVRDPKRLVDALRETIEMDMDGRFEKPQPAKRELEATS